jgi:hypothetical protein
MCACLSVFGSNGGKHARRKRQENDNAVLSLRHASVESSDQEKAIWLAPIYAKEKTRKIKEKKEPSGMGTTKKIERNR